MTPSCPIKIYFESSLNHSPVTGEHASHVLPLTEPFVWFLVADGGEQGSRGTGSQSTWPAGPGKGRQGRAKQSKGSEGKGEVREGGKGRRGEAGPDPTTHTLRSLPGTILRSYSHPGYPVANRAREEEPWKRLRIRVPQTTPHQLRGNKVRVYQVYSSIKRAERIPSSSSLSLDHGVRLAWAK